MFTLTFILKLIIIALSSFAVTAGILTLLKLRNTIIIEWQDKTDNQIPKNNRDGNDNNVCSKYDDNTDML